MRRSRVVLIVLAGAAVLLALLAALSLLFMTHREASVPAPSVSSSAEERMRREAEEEARRRFVVEENGVRRVSCPRACDRERDCELRPRDACLAVSCDDDSDGRVRIATRSDFCLADADTCADVVLCTCEEACWRRGECSGDHSGDKQCEAACRTLARQQPRALYVENRCVLESACADLPACGVVDARRGARRETSLPATSTTPPR